MTRPELCNNAKETAKAETPTRSTSDCAPSRPSITYQSILALQPDAHNPRTHSKRQIRRIADSIRTFGFTNPILVDERGQVMAGHARLEAAKRLGLSPGGYCQVKWNSRVLEAETVGGRM